MCFLSQLFIFTWNITDGVYSLRAALWHYFVCNWPFKHNEQRKHTQFSTGRQLYMRALWVWAQNLWEWIQLCTVCTIPCQSSSPVTSTIYWQINILDTFLQDYNLKKKKANVKLSVCIKMLNANIVLWYMQVKRCCMLSRTR